jgi:hypothetical protein
VGLANGCWSEMSVLARAAACWSESSAPSRRAASATLGHSGLSARKPTLELRSLRRTDRRAVRLSTCARGAGQARGGQRLIGRRGDLGKRFQE